MTYSYSSGEPSLSPSQRSAALDLCQCCATQRGPVQTLRRSDAPPWAWRAPLDTLAFTRLFWEVSLASCKLSTDSCIWQSIVSEDAGAAVTECNTYNQTFSSFTIKCSLLEETFTDLSFLLFEIKDAHSKAYQIFYLNVKDRIEFYWIHWLDMTWSD